MVYWLTGNLFKQGEGGMRNKSLENIIEKLEPGEALEQMAPIIKKLFPLLEEQARLDFVVSLIGDAGSDKVSSMVHLWLAECMDEGVDPTQMCQTLMDKVFQSKQLKAVADSEILVLFENWLDELEEEVISKVKKHPSQEFAVLAEGLGLSRSGTMFLLTKLRREGRI
jgi:hypothetical protein